jgi:hypothetical protein
MESDIVIVQAPVATQTDAELKSAANALRQRHHDQSQRTSVCSVQ